MKNKKYTFEFEITRLATVEEKASFTIEAHSECEAEELLQDAINLGLVDFKLNPNSLVIPSEQFYIESRNVIL